MISLSILTVNGVHCKAVVTMETDNGGNYKEEPPQMQPVRIFILTSLMLYPVPWAKSAINVCRMWILKWLARQLILSLPQLFKP